MSTNVGSIHYDLSLDKSKFDSATDEVTSKLTHVGKRIAQFSTVAVTAFLGFSVKSAASLEQTRIGLENMLGSADGARDMLKDVQKFAAETPFQFPELADTVKQLIAFGFSGDDAYKTMRNLGDVSSAIGAPIGDLAYLMGTLKTQGRAFTRDIVQFAQRGIPIYEYLSKVVGASGEELKSMIEEGKIGFPEVEEAFKIMTGEGGKFYKTMEKQSQSFSGRLSTLKDELGKTARELVGLSETGDIVKGSLFDKLTTSIEYLNKNLPMMIENLKNAVNRIRPVVQQWWWNIMEVAKAIADYLQPKLEALRNTVIDRVMPVIERLYNDVIKPLAPIIGSVLVFAIGFLIDSMNFWITVSSGVIYIIMNLIQWIKDLIGGIGDLAGWIIDRFKDIYNFVKNVVDNIIGWFGGLKGNIVDGLKGLYDAIVGPFKAPLDWIISKLDAILSKFGLINKQQSGFKSGMAGGGGGGSGGGFASGGYTGSGPSNAIAGFVHRGEYVIPKNQVDQNTGMPKMSGGATNIYGNINIGSQSDADYFFSKLARNQELSMRGLSTMTGTVG